MKRMDKRIGIIGPGRLGLSLAHALAEKGCCLAGVTGANAKSTAQAADILKVAGFTDKNELAKVADIIFLTVPDRLILPVAEELVAGGLREGTAIFHCSGALSALQLPVSAGILRGSFHPLQSFADDAKSFYGVYIAIDGEAAALGQKLCLLLGGKPMSVPAEERALYHAAACIASNHLVTLVDWAQGLMSRWTATPQEGVSALLPLIEGSIANITRLGTEKALTGPVARGDSETVAKHLSVLPDELKTPYRLMSAYTLDLAIRANLLTPEQVADMKNILGEKE